MFDDFVSVDTTPLFKSKTGNRKACHLLWGDGVKFRDGENSTRQKVSSRGYTGWIKKNALGGESLLEYYFIDVGQGDGMLIKTPDFKHIMIDGGLPRVDQDTGKNAADFVDWKFVKDYGKSRIELDAMIISHCDMDHYGGLLDLMDAKQNAELDAGSVHIESIYHAGLSWWKKANGSGRELGPSATQNTETFWIRLLEDRQSVLAALADESKPQLAGKWAAFMSAASKCTTKSGQATTIQRLSTANQHVPGYSSDAADNPAIQILGPIEFDLNGNPALRKFSGGNSKNTNGASLLLRVDYGRTRVLLTGDLNKQSQATLLKDYAGNRLEFACDVAKACHHGSDDVSYAFLQAIRPAVTVISSGDNEGYDHPRASIIAASATSGYLQQEDDELVSPLIYSTELARSVDLGVPIKLEQRERKQGRLETIDQLTGKELDLALLHLKKTKRKKTSLGNALVVGGLIYGLVNIRTDGNKILCATRDEKSKKWHIKVIHSRF